ncbi:hypothetical protein [Reyranella sp. CPCC 100927]|uniref:hypothetical protein n=1 Tax=Reyranella sp. CPCC 100927 TaxID=2599616 RepID=UPI0011B477B4|nr:hypothetical protein [Reyranella sp. CPCC 100927]TWT10058.1 hypothetical protein FQU96_18360 [Reyranella sp. CPCC 100927]
MKEKLFIYDTVAADNRKQAEVRFSAIEHAFSVHALPVASKAELQSGLDKLVADGRTFERVLFQTHGNTGRIWIGEDVVRHTDWQTTFAGRNYHRLFPAFTRVYFDGCLVADGDMGTAFLTAAGATLLRQAGGVVFASTELGEGIAVGVPFVGGHTLYSRDSFEYIYFKPGGIVDAKPSAARVAMTKLGW